MIRNAFRSLIGLATVVCLVLPAAAQQAPETGRYELTWFFATVTRAGPVATRAPERTPFATEAECNAFGSQMTARMQDWVRGLVRADWDHPVGVRFQCTVAGSPT